MQLKVEQSKSEILRQFASRVPNAERYSVDYGRGVLTVWFDGIHAQEYQAARILEAFEQGAAKQGFTVVWKQ